MEVSSSELLAALRTITKGELLSTCRQIPPSSEPLKGVSEVSILDDEDDAVTLFERGKWYGVSGDTEMAYTNALRFRLAENGNVILEHLRYGKERPVALLELHRVGPGHYKSIAPHVCKEDIYTGDVLFDEHYVHLSWQITGPKKNTQLRAVYTQV